MDEYYRGVVLDSVKNDYRSILFISFYLRSREKLITLGGFYGQCHSFQPSAMVLWHILGLKDCREKLE